MPIFLLDIKTTRLFINLLCKKFEDKPLPDSIKSLENPNNLILLRTFFKLKLPSLSKGNLISLTLSFFNVFNLFLLDLLKKIVTSLFFIEVNTLEEIETLRFLSKITIAGDFYYRPLILHDRSGLSLIIVLLLVNKQLWFDLRM